MKNFLSHIFGEHSDSDSSEKSTARDLQVATAALLLEVANADDEFADDEREVIVRLLKEHFGITSQEVEEVLKATSRELDKRIDIYYFTKQINEHFTKPQKIEIIEMVWRVIYADNHLTGHEDYLVHRFAKLLRLEHSLMIDAKLRIKNEK
jgi:uncharacterized tellurite resistance protein B-like protein